MSSQVNIDVKVKTDEAASDVKKLGDDIKKIKGKAPVKVEVDTREARTKITDIKKALSELQVGSGVSSAFGAAMGTLSQQATHLSDGLTGASKSAADMGISMGIAAANALGPWGQLVAGVAGAIGMIQNLEQEQITQINQTRQLQQLQGDLGGRYAALSDGISATATSSERLQIITQRVQQSFSAQIALANQLTGALSNLNRGGVRSADQTAEAYVRAAEGAMPAIRRLMGTQASLNDVIAGGDALLRRFGQSVTITGNALVDQGNRTAALREVQRKAAQDRLRELEAERDRLVQFNRTFTTQSDEQRTALQQLRDAETRVGVSRAHLTQITRESTTATNQALQATQELTAAQKAAAAQEMSDATKERRRLAALAAATNAPTARQLRDARNQIFDAVSAAQHQERLTILRASTDEKERGTQRYRNAVAELVYRQGQTMRTIEIARAEEELGRVRRENGENEATRQTRLAGAAQNLLRIQREVVEAQDAEATRRREIAEAEATQAMEAANAVRTAQDNQLQGMSQMVAANESLRAAREGLALASLDEAFAGTSAVQVAQAALPAIQEQIRLANERITAARERSASEADINSLIRERIGLETQQAQAQTRIVQAQRTQISVGKIYGETMTEAGKSMTTSLVGAAGAAIFAGENVGEALQKALAATLQQIAIESAVKALFHTASGFGALAFGLPNASIHFKSAAGFAATAVAAGVGGAAIAPSGESAPTTGATTSPRAEAPSRRDEDEGRGAPRNISISINAFQSADSARSLIVRSLREAGYNGQRV